MATDIDSEVRQLIELAHDEAWEILVEYRDVLDELVLELMEKETLGKDELARIFGPVAKRPPHNTYEGFGRRAPSDKPPVMTPAELHAAVGAGRAGGNGSGPDGVPSPAPRPGSAPYAPGGNGNGPGGGRHASPEPDGWGGPKG